MILMVKIFIKVTMFQNSKYSNNMAYKVTTNNEKIKKLWQDNTLLFMLKNENYNLSEELARVKKHNESLEKEKNELLNQLSKVDYIHRIQPKLPEEIENLFSMVQPNIKEELYPKVEKMLDCVTCVVCNSSIKSVVYLECRHLVSCVECNKLMGNKCPLCREESKRIVIYH